MDMLTMFEFIKPKYGWLARDEDGEWYAYETKPTLREDRKNWNTEDGDYRTFNEGLFNLPTCGDFRCSLIERPVDYADWVGKPVYCASSPSELQRKIEGGFMWTFSGYQRGSSVPFLTKDGSAFSYCELYVPEKD